MVTWPFTGTARGVDTFPAVRDPDPMNTVTVPMFMIVTSFSVAVVLTDPSAPNVVEDVFSGFQIRLELVPMLEFVCWMAPSKIGTQSRFLAGRVPDGASPGRGREPLPRAGG